MFWHMTSRATLGRFGCCDGWVRFAHRRPECTSRRGSLKVTSVAGRRFCSRCLDAPSFLWPTSKYIYVLIHLNSHSHIHCRFRTRMSKTLPISADIYKNDNPNRLKIIYTLPCFYDYPSWHRIHGLRRAHCRAEFWPRCETEERTGHRFHYLWRAQSLDDEVRVVG